MKNAAFPPSGKHWACQLRAHFRDPSSHSGRRPRSRGGEGLRWVVQPGGGRGGHPGACLGWRGPEAGTAPGPEGKSKQEGRGAGRPSRGLRGQRGRHQGPAGLPETNPAAGLRGNMRVCGSQVSSRGKNTPPSPAPPHPCSGHLGVRRIVSDPDRGTEGPRAPASRCSRALRAPGQARLQRPRSALPEPKARRRRQRSRGSHHAGPTRPVLRITARLPGARRQVEGHGAPSPEWGPPADPTTSLGPAAPRPSSSDLVPVAPCRGAGSCPFSLCTCSRRRRGTRLGTLPRPCPHSVCAPLQREGASRSPGRTRGPRGRAQPRPEPSGRARPSPAEPRAVRSGPVSDEPSVRLAPDAGWRAGFVAPGDRPGAGPGGPSGSPRSPQRPRHRAQALTPQLQSHDRAPRPPHPGSPGFRPPRG